MPQAGSAKESGVCSSFPCCFRLPSTASKPRKITLPCEHSPSQVRCANWAQQTQPSNANCFFFLERNLTTIAFQKSTPHVYPGRGGRPKSRQQICPGPRNGVAGPQAANRSNQNPGMGRQANCRLMLYPEMGWQAISPPSKMPSGEIRVTNDCLETPEWGGRTFLSAKKPLEPRLGVAGHFLSATMARFDPFSTLLLVILYSFCLQPGRPPCLGEHLHRHCRRPPASPA